MRVDICIPAYNEADIIETSVNLVRAACGARAVRILVVDNASTDDTAPRARAAGAVVMAVERRGKGAAVCAAAAASEADIFCYTDADLSADPKHIPEMIELVEHGEVDVVIGSRLLDERLVQRSLLRTFTSRVFNILRRLLLGIAVSDSQCGLKVMNARGRAALAACTETGWFFDLEFLARAEQQHLRIGERPVAWDEYRFPGRASKLNIVADALKAIIAMIRIRRKIVAE